MRKANGSRDKGYSYSIGACSIDAAEAWALLKGIQLAASLRLERVCFETDSLNIVKAINQNGTVDNVTRNILHACSRELNKIAMWTISFAPREQNRAADCLAKEFNHSNGLKIFDTTPEVISQILEEDRVGLPVWRQLDSPLL
ncbi:PREDICTED: uncharacterized protein LOC109180248 [Ipomoea nil]|uniref:uncharacterized protein LOC109180248 n=1 Tax=Ipomoea nil TaxID=35883 RepID=UPI000900D4D6|nr:PREDICTED: uncharacterized protein LOC109180248 [Ipomoea nil]